MRYYYYNSLNNSFMVEVILPYRCEPWSASFIIITQRHCEVLVLIVSLVRLLLYLVKEQTANLLTMGLWDCFGVQSCRFYLFLCSMQRRHLMWGFPNPGPQGTPPSCLTCCSLPESAVLNQSEAGGVKITSRAGKHLSNGRCFLQSLNTPPSFVRQYLHTCCTICHCCVHRFTFRFLQKLWCKHMLHKNWETERSNSLSMICDICELRLDGSEMCDP